MTDQQHPITPSIELVSQWVGEMTDSFSPAAQAVQDAAWSAYWSSGEACPNDAEVIAAAVLRAAANYCPADRRILMTIADELEAPR